MEEVPLWLSLLFSFHQSLGPPFLLVLLHFSQWKLTNLKDFIDALDLSLVLVFWLISHEPHQCCKTKPDL